METERLELQKMFYSIWSKGYKCQYFLHGLSNLKKVLFWCWNPAYLRDQRSYQVQRTSVALHLCETQVWSTAKNNFLKCPVPICLFRKTACVWVLNPQPFTCCATASLSYFVCIETEVLLFSLLCFCLDFALTFFFALKKMLDGPDLAAKSSSQGKDTSKESCSSFSFLCWCYFLCRLITYANHISHTVKILSVPVLLAIEFRSVDYSGK